MKQELTKLELISAMALQALLSKEKGYSEIQAAEIAVDYAKALLRRVKQVG